MMIAIDGPQARVSRKYQEGLAAKLGFAYLDTARCTARLA